jgi:hypothetical protein
MDNWFVFLEPSEAEEEWGVIVEWGYIEGAAGFCSGYFYSKAYYFS